MKISKLFHWLYAFLMFLPVLALAPSLFYFAFNQQSQNYTDVQVTETYEYETNEVNSVNDLVVGNIYKYTYSYASYLDLPNLTSYLSASKLYKVNYLYSTYNYDIDIYNLENATFRLFTNNDNYLILSIYDNNNNYVGSPLNLGGIEQEMYIVYSGFYDSRWISFISESDYLGEKNVEVVRSEQSPMNIFYTAVNYVYDMPVFSWAKNSFLALPITYITGLFGMASTNVVNYYLSYWLAISIVYLVFDLIMYVPLLVHRWIDKGMIE